MAAGVHRERRTGDGGAAAIRAATARTRCNRRFLFCFFLDGSDAGGERPLVGELQPEPRHAPFGASVARGLRRSESAALRWDSASSTSPPPPPHLPTSGRGHGSAFRA